MAKIFISYPIDDKPLAERLAVALTDIGHDVWLDRAPQNNFRAPIDNALNGADVILAIVSASSLTAHHQRAEVRQGASLSKLVVVSFCVTRVTPPWLPDVYIHDFANWNGSANASEMEALTKALVNRSGQRAGRPQATATTPSEVVGRKMFISHRVDDAGARANELVGHLERRQLSCWIAPRDVKRAIPYPGQIVEAIEASDALVVAVSDGANQSPDVLQEVEIAHRARKLIVPVIMDGTTPSSGLRYFLGVRQHIQWQDAEQTAREIALIF